MEMNDRVKVFQSTLEEIKGAIKEENANEAFNYTSYYIRLSEHALQESPNDDNLMHLAMKAYTLGAFYVFKIINIEYSYARHQQGRNWADMSILLAFRIASAKTEDKYKLDFLDAMETGLWLGQTTVIKEALDISDIWADQLLKKTPDDEEVQRICTNYKTAKQHSYMFENIFQTLNPNK